MKLEFEIGFTLNDVPIEGANHSLIIEDGEREVIKTALLNAVGKYREVLLPIVVKAIDEA